MKKAVALVLLLCMVFTCMGAAVAADTQEAVFLYVATDGADTNNGTIDAPYATLQAAVTAARAIDDLVVINVRGGSYRVTDTVELTAADSNLVIRAYKDEKVEFTGGDKVPYSAFSKVTDSAVLNRIVEKNGKDKVMQANLKDLGITEYGEMRPQGFLTADNSGYSTSLTYQDDFLTLASYPNNGYTMINKIIDDGSKSDLVNGSLQPCTFTVSDSRYKQWTEADDIWVFGYFRHDWADTTMSADVDFESGEISTFCAKGYNPVVDRRVKFINLLEELDAAGEWYVDRENGILYLIPPEGFKSGEELVFTAHDKPFFTINEAKNITFQGIRFANTRARGFDMEKADGIVIDACELTGIGDCAVYVSKCYNTGVKNSHLHDLGSWGVYFLECGDRETLTPGNCFVDNCHIETFSQYRKTYSPAIHMWYDVGTRVSHNEIHDAPHFAIRYDSNDNIMEYNEFYDICQDTADSGAVYTGRDWTTRGNEIRYNYFHDLTMIETTTGMEMQAVYLDDMHSSTAVFGNVFYKVDSVALYGGGRDNTFENNIMLECKKPFVFDARATTWASWQKGSEIMNHLEEVPYSEVPIFSLTLLIFFFSFS